MVLTVDLFIGGGRLRRRAGQHLAISLPGRRQWWRCVRPDLPGRNLRVGIAGLDHKPVTVGAQVIVKPHDVTLYDFSWHQIISVWAP